MKKANTICFVAGRSGGHIKPGLILAQNYRKQDPNAHIIFFSTTNSLDQTIIGESNDVNIHIRLPLGNIPRKSFLLPLYAIQLFWCIIKSCMILQKYKPEKVISMGGYISLPVCLAAKLSFIPIELFELNALPGKASKVLAPLCKTIKVCFKTAQPYFANYKVQHVAYPIQFDLSTICTKNKAIESLQLFPDKKTVLVLGGSQGSLFINNIIKSWIEHSSEKHSSLQIIHQTGKHDTFDWKNFYTSKNIASRVFAYSNSMELYYQAADLIICRAGAGTLFEALFFKKPCIVIPLQTATTNHQVDNAQAMHSEYPRWVNIFYQHELNAAQNKFYEKITTCLYEGL